MVFLKIRILRGCIYCAKSMLYALSATGRAAMQVSDAELLTKIRHKSIAIMPIFSKITALCYNGNSGDHAGSDALIGVITSRRFEPVTSTE